MKKMISAVVDLIDYDTFEPFPGAESFEANFKTHRGKLRNYFEFHREGDLNDVVDELAASNLKYKLYYKVQLESDEELRNYPAVNIVFHSPKHPVLDYKDGSFAVNSKVSKKPFHNHFYPQRKMDHLLFDKKGMAFFKKNVPNISFVEVGGTKKGAEHYLLDEIEVLKSPRIYPESCQVELSPLNDRTYNITNADGRYSLPNNSLKEIKHGVFLREKSFVLKGKEYPDSATRYVCSGEFALEFSRSFDLEKDMCELFIPPLNSWATSPPP